RSVSDPKTLDQPVATLMAPPFPTVDEAQPLGRASEILHRHPAVLVVRAGRPIGIVTRFDLVQQLSRSK
ncbi:MAG: CBS domain-containing protein, partial [Methanobacteriota archaeon]